MPELSKNQVRDLIRQLIDDPGGKFWSTGNLDLLIEGCLDELWGELIDQFSWLRWTETIETPVAPGFVELRSDATTSNLLRLYRVQKVIRGEQPYRFVDQQDVTVAAGVVLAAPNNSYTFLGNTLHLFPYSLDAVTIQYNSLPEPFTSLSPSLDPDEEGDDDISFVEWPDGYHMAYIYDIASKAIEKGNRGESEKLAHRADVSLFRLKAFLRKQHVGPTTPYLVDDGLDNA